MSDIERAEQAEAALQRVRELHEESGIECLECDQRWGSDSWPCSTIEAIDSHQ